MTASCRVSIRRTDDGSVVALQGELDLSTTGHVREELTRLESEQQLVVDLRGLSFLDSTGLSVLISLDQRIRAAGRRLHFIRGADHVHRVFEVTALADRFIWIEPAELP